MHRHGYKGRKFGRETDQRTALIKGLASELIDHQSITTTVPKAKELVPYVEKLITKAKKGDLHNRRLIISKVAHPSAAHKLVDEIAPKLTARNSGHLRIEKSGWRKGDNAAMAIVSFVDDMKAPEAKKTEKVEAPVDKKDEKTSTAKVVATKKAAKPVKKAAPKENK
jgi:large subunit ribosomal protein L17